MGTINSGSGSVSVHSNYGKRKTKKDIGASSSSDNMIVVGDERKHGSKRNLIFDHKLSELKQRHHLSAGAVARRRVTA